MENSNFANPHGLDDPAHYSSAYDLAIAGWNALQNPTIAGIVKQSQASINGYSFTNITNFIRRYPGATGIKPGETENAGLCIVASANRFGKNAIVVLLNSPGMRTESDELMDYAFAQILAAEKKETPATASFGYIGLPDTGKLRSYSLMVNNLQANLNETLRYLVTLQRLFGGHTLSQRD
jgi:D-alanyl-D-alanine carboxypeptidase